MKVDIEKVIDWLLENTFEVTTRLSENFSVTDVQLGIFRSKEEMIEEFREAMEE